MPFFASDNAEIYYETWGEGQGPWLTLLNGLSRSSTDFKAMARFFNERNWRCLLIDNRGAGKTEAPVGFSVEESAHDVVRLWDHLKISSSALLGISYGGMLAMHVAIDAASRVSKLILVSTSPRSADIKRTEDISHYFSESFRESHQIMIKAFVKEMEQAFVDPARAGKSASQRKAVEGVDVSAPLKKIKIPTLVLHGGDDAIVPVAVGKKTAAAITGSELEIFEGTGHLLLAETPKRLYEKVWEFICR